MIAASDRRVIPAEETDAGLRLDVFLAGAIDVTRSAAQKLLSAGLVTAAMPDGCEKELPKNARVKPGDVFFVTVPEPVPLEVRPENIPLDIRYEDDDVIVISKPKGMVVHPAPGHETGTLVSALLYAVGDSLSGIGGTLRPGIVHRIDRDTTGLIAVAKNDRAHVALSAQLADHSMHRIYDAIVIGNLKSDEGTVDAPIGRSSADRKKMAVVKDGKRAVTHYTVLERFPGFTYVRLRLETGRTHQIRVHMSHIGHPLLGDEVYGGGHTPFEKKHAALLTGQCLHAGTLVFRHPTSGEEVTVTSPLPADFSHLLDILRTL